MIESLLHTNVKITTTLKWTLALLTKCLHHVFLQSLNSEEKNEQHWNKKKICRLADCVRLYVSTYVP